MNKMNKTRKTKRIQNRLKFYFEEYLPKKYDTVNIDGEVFRLHVRKDTMRLIGRVAECSPETRKLLNSKIDDAFRSRSEAERDRIRRKRMKALAKFAARAEKL